MSELKLRPLTPLTWEEAQGAAYNFELQEGANNRL